MGSTAKLSMIVKVKSQVLGGEIVDGVLYVRTCEALEGEENARLSVK